MLPLSMELVLMPVPGLLVATVCGTSSHARPWTAVLPLSVELVLMPVPGLLAATVCGTSSHACPWTACCHCLWN